MPDLNGATDGIAERLDRTGGLAYHNGGDAGCPLVFVPRIGQSMNLELPALYAGYFGARFGGLAA